MAEDQKPNAHHTFHCFCQTFPTSQNHDCHQNQGNFLHKQPPTLSSYLILPLFKPLSTSCQLWIWGFFALFSSTIKTCWFQSACREQHRQLYFILQELFGIAFCSRTLQSNINTEKQRQRHQINNNDVSQTVLEGGYFKCHLLFGSSLNLQVSIS